MSKKLPLDHPSALPRDHEVFDYPSYYHFQDTFSNYHFDKWTDCNDPSNEIHRNLQFVGKSMDNVMSEVLPFVRENGKSGYINDLRFATTAPWFYEMEIPTFNHGGYKEQVKPEKHPTLCKIIDWFEFEGQIQPSILEKMPGNWEIWHVDTHCGHTSGFRQNELFRVLINLQDWEFGQLGLWGTKPVIQWKQGEAMWWNPDVPHMVANASRHIRYTFRLTGIPSAKTLEKAKLGGVIDVDEL